MSKPWIGVDLDGTLAHYENWEGPGIIGAPVPAMVERIKGYLSQGIEVRIFTARVSSSATEADISLAREAIAKFCISNFGVLLPVTAEKDFAMTLLFDDRCQTVQANTGEILSQLPRTKIPDLNTEEKFNAWLETVETVLKSIRAARIAQLQKHGLANHDIPTWLAIIGEEFGELQTAYLDTKFSGNPSPARLIEEARDVAASAAALIQYLEQGYA